MKKLAITLSMMLFAAGAVFAQSDLQGLVVIKHNKSETVTVKQLKSRCDTYEKQIGKKLTLDEKKQVLTALVDEKLMIQAATKSGITIPDSAVDQYFMQGISQQIGAVVTEKELDSMLKKQQGITLDDYIKAQVGMTTAEYKAYLKSQLIVQQYVLQQKQNDIQKVAPTDEEIRLFYESNKASFVQNDSAKCYMVIVPKGTDPDKAKLKLNDLRNKYVDKKMTFDQLEVQSRIEGSGYQAGSLLLPKTAEAAVSIGMTFQNMTVLFNQKEGFVSDIQETEADYRFISIGKKYDAKMLSISDVVQPETTVTVYDYIRSNLAQQKQLQYVQIAAQELANSLHTPENIEEKKIGAALDKLLNWGE